MPPQMMQPKIPLFSASNSAKAAAVTGQRLLLLALMANNPTQAQTTNVTAAAPTTGTAAASVTCECGKVFQTHVARAQHFRTAAIHKSKVKCTCGKTFRNDAAQAEHFRTARRHAVQPDAAAAAPEAAPAVATGIEDSSHPLKDQPIEFVKEGATTLSTSKKKNTKGKRTHMGPYVLCDKDCAWCGHCADFVDFDLYL
ncbi:hypothetical protein R3P38DRAFT_1633276 [Favolaschia claudopus]|uniref:C2H2-type domain-containing protein n=1 Tax=Favolaschia claudopus TaxID=2862362 RepID=A0AAW0DJS0_9AGAR